MLVSLASLLGAQVLDMDYIKSMKARNIGPGGMSGRVTAIDVHPENKDVFYVGTASGGLWKTSNGGVNFNPVFDDQEVANIGALAIDPSNADVIWAGTGEGNPRNSLNGGYGIYRSLDAGRSWQLMGLEKTRHIHRIIVHPANPEVIYVGAIGSPWGPHPERGVFKSTDGGQSWEQVLKVNDLTGVADMVMDPKNPDKLFVAMWEHRRWPWFFKSGGEGSGLYLTVDGGENWKQLTSDDGLPGGELGRMGLAVAAGNNNYVYALIESKKNAIYRSTDGGYTWEKRGDRNFGGRPFYYAEIYVDPENENRLYSLHSRVSVSEDGGKDFSTLIDYNIHLDHHAWWIHPEDPSFMIDGNDGGLAITYDRGKNWRHVSNLPVSQFYHIRTDNEIPYNVYGGMQDNGSWRGPGYVWSGGGIVNTYWDFLIGGDGFDVLPVPGDPQTCYAMSQQGHVRRVNMETGGTVDIRPAQTTGEDLRFHWNAAIAQDPFNANTLYFGSQFVHKSTNRGDSWVLISKDLTTNDTAKQKFNESGGLTYDVTGAENHCCILSIEPSRVEEGLIWIGTDDGNIQMTRDGGLNWSNCSPGIRELPEGAWVPQIVASTKNAGEAWAVVNNYRLNDYAPYLFHTTDFGSNWERVIDESKVKGYVLCFVQDPKVPELQFLGTEYGLWVSIDGGKQWSKWTNGYPTVSTMDMEIQEREGDLVIGTFGRSAWVIDDLEPLRMLARDYHGTLDAGLAASHPPKAYLADWKNAPGYYFTGDAYFQGENRPYGARLSYFAHVDTTQEKKDSVSIIIRDIHRKVIRTLKQVPEPGLNRVIWNMDRKGLRMDFSAKGSDPRKGEPGGGGQVLPGIYSAEFSYGGDTSYSHIEVRADPRKSYDTVAMTESLETKDALLAKMEDLNEGLTRVRRSKEELGMVRKLAGKDISEDLEAALDSTDSELDRLGKYLFRDESVQGIYYPSDALWVEFSGTRSILGSDTPLTDNQMDKYRRLIKLADEALEKIEDFHAGIWSSFKETAMKEDLSPFSD